MSDPAVQYTPFDERKTGPAAADRRPRPNHLRDVTASSVLESQDRTAGDAPELAAETVAKLAVYAVEILDGSRSMTHLAGWVSEEVAEEIFARRALHAERRSIYRDGRRSVPRPGRVHMSRPFPHIVEAVVIMHTQARSFAVAVCLEFRRQRWRATCLTVL
ncbi:MAG: Rv3235 family protein [Leucobacter sp.]